VKNKLVVVPSIVEPIKLSPGFAKKGIDGLIDPLGHCKLDLVALCGFGCVYCSSNEGNYLRIMRARFLELTEQQLGERLLPSENPELSFIWKDIIEKLERQLAKKPKSWGAGQILVFSMLTDGFSPYLVSNGITRAALELVLAKTSFRIRVLTKNAIIGSPEWIEFFLKHKDRFVLGLSTGTLDDEWAKRVEIGTSVPSARLRALRALQDAGLATYGMLCPIFPGVAVEDLVEAIRPEKCEAIWAEPFNDRANWMKVRDGHEPGSAAYKWFDQTFASGRDGWSKYAVDLYVRLRDIASKGGWINKLCFLLYENYVSAADAPRLAGFRGLSLQSTPDNDNGGVSANAAVAAVQRAEVPAPKHGRGDVYEYLRENYSEELVECFRNDGIAVSWTDRLVQS
jgi:DNA repair photolyase